MSEQMREAVSALADGEASELELRQILARADDPELRRFWRHCHTASPSAPVEDLRFAHIDLSVGIATAIAAEPVAAAGVTSRWARPLGGMAVAASVAMAVVFGGGAFQGLTSGPAPVADTTVAASASGRVYPATVSVPQGSTSMPVSAGFQDAWPSAGGSVAAESAQMDAEAQRRLQQYLFRHTERAALNSGQGVLNFARITEIEAGQGAGE